MKKVLVTGGAGFIGSNLIRELLRQGNEVICLDNFYTGSDRNIKEYLSHPGFTMIEADVTEPFDIEAERIYHLACPASPVHYEKDPIYTSKTCFTGALNVLQNADRYNARVLLASTSEVYGDPEVHPQREEYRGNVSSVGPRACYDEGKRIAETLFFDSKRKNGTDIRVVRIFNTYGPGMGAGDGRIVSNFITQALAGKALTVFGDGMQTRSFCYVDDTVKGLMLMMEKEDIGPGPVNIGNPDERTVLSTALKIRELSGSASEIEYRELPKDDPVRRRPDITRAKELLGWEPETEFTRGLEKTIEYFRTCI